MAPNITTMSDSGTMVKSERSVGRKRSFGEVESEDSESDESEDSESHSNSDDSDDRDSDDSDSDDSDSESEESDSSSEDSDSESDTAFDDLSEASKESRFFIIIVGKYKTLLNRAHHPRKTANFLKQTNDPAVIADYLLGASLKDSPRLLEDFPLYSRMFKQKQVKVRDLLLKSSIFIRKHETSHNYYDDPLHRTGLDPKALCFDISMKQYSTKTSELYKLLKTNTEVEETIKPLIKLHTKYTGSATFISPVVNEYEDFIRHVRDFANLLKTPKLTPKERSWFTVDFDSESYRIRPSSAMMSDNGTAHMIIQCSQEALLPEESVQDPNNIVDMESVKDHLKQLVGYMVLAECPYGHLTDGKTMIFVEIRVSSCMNSTDTNPIVPLRVYSTNVGAFGPSCIESLISWQLKCMDLRHDREKMKQLKYKCFTSHLAAKISPSPTPGPNLGPSIPKIQINYKDYSVIKAGHSMTQMFIVPAPSLFKLDPQDRVVLKIFDKSMGYNRLYEKKLEPEWYLDDTYDQQLECVSRLRLASGYNNCFLHDYEVFAEVSTPLGVVSGKCIASKYIETVPMPKTQEVYKKVKKQLSIVHKHKIVHRDFYDPNVLYSKDGEVYIIDFEDAETEGPERFKHYSLDLTSLEEMFDPEYQSRIFESEE